MTEGVSAAFDTSDASRLVGACAEAIGAAAVLRSGALTRLLEQATGGAEQQSAPNAREGAIACIEELSARLGRPFEPLCIPALHKLVDLVGDKDRNVAQAATKALRATLGRLNPLAVKIALPALCEGLSSQSSSWRSKEARKATHRSPRLS